MSEELIKVVAAVIQLDGHYLIARRASHKSNAGQWEFPGGKLEATETPAAALQREILEELGVNIVVKEFFDAKEHHYETVKIELSAYLAELLDFDFKLTDHDEIRWVLPADFSEYQFSPADEFIIESLQSDEPYFTV